MSKNRGRPANTGVKNSSEPKFRDVDGLHPIFKRFTGVFFLFDNRVGCVI